MKYGGRCVVVSSTSRHNQRGDDKLEVEAKVGVGVEGEVELEFEAEVTVEVEVTAEVVVNIKVDSTVEVDIEVHGKVCLLYTSPSPRDQRGSRMPSSA